MCDEDIFSDESLKLMLENMAEEEIKQFWKDLEESHNLSELIKKGYSFGGGEFIKSVFVYKK